MNRPRTIRRKQDKRQWHMPLPVTTASVLGISLWLLGLSLWSHGAIDKATPKSNPKVLSPHALIHIKEEISILQDLWPDDHNEEEFAASLMSCVEDCLQDPVPTPEIVALLYPPGEFGLLFVEFIRSTALTHASHTTTQILWEPTSHLPSTGRYSHIVRFVTLPLLLAAGDALLQYAAPDTIVWQDVQETVPLLLHWHCALSNLVTPDSPPYPLMTMSMEEIEEDPLQQSFLLRYFIPSLDPMNDDEQGIDPDFQENLVYQLHEIVDRVQPLLERLETEFQESTSTSKPDDISLEHLVSRLVREFLINDVDCPNDLPPMPIVPLGMVARGVYDWLQAMPTNTINPRTQDEIRCQEDALSNQNICQKLPKAFDTKGLVQVLYDQQQQKQQQQPQDEEQEVTP